MGDQNPTAETKVKSTKPEPRSTSKPEYIYFWDRIIGALAALVLLLGLIGYGLYAWLKPSRPPVSVAAEEVVAREKLASIAALKTSDNIQESEPSSSIPATETAVDRREILDASPASPSDSPRSESSPDQSPSEEGPAVDRISRQMGFEADKLVDLPRLAEAEESPAGIVDPVPSPPPLTETSPVPKLEVEEINGPVALPPPFVDEVVNPAPASPLAREEIAEVVSARTPESREEKPRSTEQTQKTGETEAVAATPEEATSNGLFSSQKIFISSPAVRRFLLAQTVTDNEPNGNLGDITMNTEGVAAVYSFSEVIGLAGEVLEYRWLHESKTVLHIRVPVGAERWRSHAQKSINAGMKGSWRVELRDSTGRLLAHADFVF